MNVLVVDDEPSVLELLENLLVMEGYQVTTAANGREALERLREKRFDTAILDIGLPDQNGFLLFENIKRKHPRLARKVVFLSGVPFSEQAIQNMTNLGAVYLPKPIRPQTLIGTLQVVAGKNADIDSQPDSAPPTR